MKVLLLAGTREARELSFALEGIDLVSSLAGATQRPAKLGGHMRVGGFGGVSGLLNYLQDHGITHVIDATHPFAVQMSRNAILASKELGRPLFQVLRPPWETQSSWTTVPDLDAASEVLVPGSHVFLATGRASLAHFVNRPDVEFTTRVIDELPDRFPLAKGRFLASRPPFSIEDEVETLRNLGVSWLVARNSGGTGGIEKVIAANKLGIKVVMVSRPEPQDVPRVETVSEALSYMEAQGWWGA